MPKVRGLSRSTCRRSSRSLLHLSDNLKSQKAVIPERNEQQEEMNENQLNYCISLSSSSLLDEQQQRHMHADSSPSLKNRRRVSFEDTFGTPPQSASPNDDVIPDCAIESNSQHYHHKELPLHSNSAQNIEMVNHGASITKLSRSGCLTSLVDQVTDKWTAINSISEDNLSNAMSDDAVRNSPLCDQTLHFSQDTLCFSKVETDTNMNSWSPTPSCPGWGQFVDVIPPEPSTRRRCLGSPVGSSYADMRYSPYGIISWRERQPWFCPVRDSVVPDDGDLSSINWHADDTMVTLRHSPSTDVISSALCRVQISGTKQD